MTTPRKPPEVLQVELALMANAKSAGRPLGAVSCRRASLAPSYSGPEEMDEWIVGSNFEDGSSSMVYRGGKWYYREPFEGTDKPMKGGFNEALGNCLCFFTG